MDVRHDFRAGQLRKLTEVSRALTYAMSLADVFRLTVDCAAELLAADKAVLMLCNEENGELSVRAAHGVPDEVCDRFSEPLDETLVRRLRVMLGVEEHQFLGVPLVVSSEVIGILAVGSRRVTHHPDEEEWLLSALADQAAVALEKSRLDEAAQLRERLIGIVGHDLRSPLQTIRLAASALERAKLDERSHRHAARITSSALRMKDMVEQLLDFTRARLGGGIPVELDQVDLGPLCRNVVDEVGAAYPSARFELDVPGRLVVSCDRDRMFQVLVNLATNGWVHGNKRHAIVVAVRKEELTAVVSVENHGEPIPPDVAAELFDPFRRLEAARPEQPHQGLGLGLYIAREIMVAHRGSIRVECVDGKVIFSARLPLPPA